MPKRSTLTFSSEDAPESDEAKVAVYYCKYTGDAVLITDADLARLPKRRTDSARVLDTEKHVVRLKATRAEKAVLVKREGGKLEKQYRYTCGELPVCYKSEPEGRYLYIIDGALSSFNFGEGGDAAGGGADAPVPPCIQRTNAGTTQVAIDIEDRARHAAVSKIGADEVAVAVMSKTHQANDELLTFLGKTLRLRASDMSLVRGWSTRSKLLIVKGLTPREVYDRLREAMEANGARAGKFGGGATGGG